jgi:hypothetical protein
MSPNPFNKCQVAVLIIMFCTALIVRTSANTFSYSPLDSWSGDSNHYDLGDLSHSNAYIWGINAGVLQNGAALKDQLNNGYHITSAYITITNINNWDVRDTNNHLFFDLLDNPLAGVHAYTDDPYDNGINQGTISDYFSGKISTNYINSSYGWRAYGVSTNGTILSGVANSGAVTQIVYQNGQNWYHDSDSAAHTITVNFDSSILGTLATYITNAHMGSNAADFGIGFDPDCHYFNDGIKLTIVTEKNRPPCVPDGASTVLLVGGVLMALGFWRRRLTV